MSIFAIPLGNEGSSIESLGFFFVENKKRNSKREHSSVGLERLPYKQRVGGSTPSAPTKKACCESNGLFWWEQATS